jgi:hypothetical protein
LYWQGNTVADDWGTSYAGHFLIEAEKRDMFYLILNRNGFRTNREAENNGDLHHNTEMIYASIVYIHWL